MEENNADNKKFSELAETLNSSDSENDSLQIAIENESTPKKKYKSKKHPDFDGKVLDRTIKETIQKCENITPEAAKKMLLKLIRNEHVLALSLLKAEEQHKQERCSKTSESDDDRKSESDTPSTPKLTRLKAKQMNKTLPQPRSLNTTEPCEEVIALIQDELKSDDEDEEYQPCEDDNLSDEDITNNTISDIESQPSTPGSALLYNEQDFDSPVKDGEFKVPRSLSLEEQENISRRTRSKLCLTTTAIETIESTFIPPDITTDMYDFEQDHEVDNEWKEFLNEFMMPLTNADEDDEKSDPEYVAAEPVPVDEEELRQVKVSKKELNQLIAELLEDSSNLNFDSEPSTSYKRSLQYDHNQPYKNKRQRITSPTNYKSPKISSKFYSPQDVLNTPPTRVEPSEPSTPCEKFKSVDQQPTSPEFIDQSYANPYYQQQLQTPQRVGFMTPTCNQSPAVFPSPMVYQSPMPFPSPAPLQLPLTSNPTVDPDFSTAVTINPPQLSQPPPILMLNAYNQLELYSSSHLITQAFCSNGIVQLPQYQSVVIQVPTIDLLQNRLDLSAVLPTQNKLNEIPIDSPPVLDEDETQNLTDDSKKQLTQRKEKLQAFAFLENLEPPEEKIFDNDAKGFTDEQRVIYEQQMRIHAQLLAQNYLQFFAHPVWWDKAETIKNNLKEVKSSVSSIFSPQTSKHVVNCLEMCEDWEKEIGEINEANKKYIEFLHNEHDFDTTNFEKKQEFKGRFHPRFMEHILNSKAILYPKLLPKVPFRAVTFNRVEPSNSELSLLALGLKRFQKELFEKLNSFNPFKIRQPSTRRIASSIVREYGSFRNERGIMKLIDNYKNHSKMNPIKYFFLHKKAPPMHHVIENVDLDKPIPPKRLMRGLLPKNWDIYKFSYERLQIHPYTTEEETAEETVDLTSEAAIEETSLLTPSIESQIICSTVSVDNLYNIEITGGEIPKINICWIPEAIEEAPVSCISLLSPIKLREKSNEEKQNNLISILKKVSDSLEKTPTKKKSVNFLLPTSAQTRRSPRFNEVPVRSQEIANTFILTQKFFIVIESFFTSYIKKLNFRNEVHPLLIRVFHWTKSIDIYLMLIKQSIMIQSKKPTASCSAESTTKPKKSISSSEEYSKKLHRKLAENRSLIMQSDHNKCSIEKDCSYAYNFLERVRKTLLENGDEELLTEFMSMLTSYEPEKESVPELYHKVETLLMPNYSELVDLFLTFLLPEHAAEIGKFFEHFVLTNMTNLLKKLNFFFNKQPSHMKKVFACLNELSNESDLTMERLKSKIQPLLKGNQLLLDWFKQIFEKPMDGLPVDLETVYIKKSLSDSDNSIDSYYEEMHSKDLLDIENNDELNACGVKYKNGKIMYQGTLLPAKISFLAHDSPLISSDKSDSEDQPICMHQIRKNVKFNDVKVPENIIDDSNDPKKQLRKYKLVDAQTLHAHAVRLNSVHAQNGEKLSDLSRLLTPPSANESNDEKNSPKKTKNMKTSGNSPKKCSKSPSSSSENSASASPPTQSSSKALQTAKKLRNFVDDVNEEPLPKKKKLVDPKALSSSKVASKAVEKKRVPPKSQKPIDIAGPSKKIELEVTPLDIKEESPSSSELPRENDYNAHSILAWTREEDKQILEEINDYGKEDLLDVLVSKINKPRSKISLRYDFLLDIIKMHTKN